MIDAYRQKLRHAIRLKKNDWVQQYFRFRIQASSDPYRVLLRPRPYRLLFILSHMRSGSSLLTHLLNANPEIIGYGETHLEYHQPQDIQSLLYRVYTRSQEFRMPQHIGNLRMHHGYVMDKLLHNHKLGDWALLNSEHVYVIFLVREPVRSLASLCDLKSHWTASDSLSYYRDRLETLVKYAQFINDSSRSLLLTYEQLLNDTQNVLETLQCFLQTRTPFSEEYQVLKTTGQKGVGDSKGNIKAGKIVRTSRPLSTPIAEDLIAQGQQAYAQSMQALTAVCRVVPVADSVAPLA